MLHGLAQLRLGSCELNYQFTIEFILKTLLTLNKWNFSENYYPAKNCLLKSR